MTAAPTHQCVQCKKNVHVTCSINFPDEDANFWEGHKCLNCSSEAELQDARVVWPPLSEQGDEEMKEGREEQDQDQEEDEQIVPNKGCTSEELEIRGRWGNQARIKDKKNGGHPNLR